MPQPAGPQDAETFVGRSRELAVLSAALRQAATGDARLALISGEPGIGKTELARAFARAAGERRRAGAVGQRVGRRRRPALLALGAGAEELRPAGRAGGARRAAGPQAAVLGQMLPELGTAPRTGRRLGIRGPVRRSSRPSARCSTRRRGPRRWP